MSLTGNVPPVGFEYGFTSISPDDIRSEATTINWLVLEQLNRLNFMFSFKLASAPDLQARKNVQKGIESTLRSLESMLSNHLNEEYDEAVNPIKQQLIKTRKVPVKVASLKHSDEERRLKVRFPFNLVPVLLIDLNPDLHLNLCSDWHDIVIQNLRNTGLLPSKRDSFAFDKRVKKFKGMKK